MYTHPAINSAAASAERRKALDFISGVRYDRLPRRGAGLDVGVIGLGFAAEVPVTRALLRRRRALFDVSGRRRCVVDRRRVVAGVRVVRICRYRRADEYANARAVVVTPASVSRRRAEKT